MSTSLSLVLPTSTARKGSSKFLHPERSILLRAKSTPGKQVWGKKQQRKPFRKAKPPSLQVGGQRKGSQLGLIRRRREEGVLELLVPSQRLHIQTVKMIWRTAKRDLFWRKVTVLSAPERSPRLRTPRLNVLL